MTASTYSRLRLLMACIAAFASLIIPQCASAQDKKPILSSSMIAQVKQRLATYYAWLNAPWTDDDAPYQKIRGDIDKDIATGQNVEAVYQRYKAQAAKAPSDPKAVFGLTYAAYRAQITPSNLDKTQFAHDLGNLYLLIGNKRASLPHTYNYARLAFLSNTFSWADPKMKDVGKRLLQRDPNDYDVEYYLAAVLNGNKDAADRQQALAYEKDLAHRQPNNPRQYLLMAMIHYNTAWIHHSQAELDACIKAYQQYFKLAPPDQQTRESIPALIKFAQNLKAQWSKAE